MTVKRDPERCSESEPWAVLSGDETELLGCHSSEEAANEQLRAVEANKHLIKGLAVATLIRVGISESEQDKSTLIGQMAENAVVARSSVRSYLRGESTPSVEVAESIAETLDIPMEQMRSALRMDGRRGVDKGNSNKEIPMNLFKKIFGIEDEDSDETASKRRHLSRDRLAEMSDDQLREMFFSFSTAQERLSEHGEELMEEFESRDLEVPEDSALARAVESVSKQLQELADEAEKDDDKEEGLDPVVEKMIGKEEIKPQGEAVMKTAFVATSPSKLDTIRNKAFSGPTGAVFNELYLEKSLGFDRDDVLLTYIVPTCKTDESGNEVPPTDEDVAKWMPYLEHVLKENDIREVVALGTAAKDALGDTADEFLPHPDAIRKQGDSGEVGRKLRRLKERLEESTVEKSYDADVVKVDDERQEITGIVYEPGKVDADNDWARKEAIRDAMVWYMENEPTVKLQHQEDVSDVVRVVEIWQARKDLDVDGEMVPEGSWLQTVKVYDENIWQAAKSQLVNGFSLFGRAEFRQGEPELN